MDKGYLDDFLNRIESDRDGLARFIASLRGGENTVSHNCASQSVQLDDDWVIEIEQGLNSIEQIVHRPRKFIAENELLLDVAKVRRTNTKTVRHLTTHSQYVQNYEEDTGEVRPLKLLSIELDEDIAIYENRFVCALVNNLIRFVELRNDDLEGKMFSYEQTNVKMQSKFYYGKSRFTCNFDIKVDDPPENATDADLNRDLFGRIQQIRRRLRIIQSSEFMKILNRAKPVRPPIQKTNLLMKNVDYNNCYKLWLFISSYRYLGYSISVKNKALPVDSDYFDDLSVLVAMGLQSMLNDSVLNKSNYDSISYSEPEEKAFTFVNNFVFTPDFEDSAQECGSDVINEYYFRRIKDELMRDVQDGEIGVENKLNVNFAKFFRSISRINEAMYNELIDDCIKDKSDKAEGGEGGNEGVKPKSLKAKQKEALKQQKERIRRRRLFLKLKWEEVERAQRMLERDEAKFYKLKEDYDDVRRANKSARVTNKKFKTKKGNRN